MLSFSLALTHPPPPLFPHSLSPHLDPPPPPPPPTHTHTLSVSLSVSLACPSLFPYSLFLFLDTLPHSPSHSLSPILVSSRFSTPPPPLSLSLEWIWVSWRGTASHPPRQRIGPLAVQLCRLRFHCTVGYLLYCIVLHCFALQAYSIVLHCCNYCIYRPFQFML